MFSIIDNSFGIFLRELDSKIHHGSTVNFQTIYDALKSRLNHSTPNTLSNDSDTLVKLLRLARNANHNNGAYFHKDGNDQVSIKVSCMNLESEGVLNFVFGNG
jgi:hypothetical protein